MIEIAVVRFVGLIVSWVRGGAGWALIGPISRRPVTGHRTDLHDQNRDVNLSADGAGTE